MRVTEATYGGLDCFVVKAADRVPKLACILCHGFGAMADDLLGLAEPILQLCGDRAEEIAFVFPGGVLALEDHGNVFGRAWWWIDLDRLLNNPSAETMHQFRHQRPPGMDEASSQLQQAVADIQAEWQLTAGQVVLGGFSQGSMLATDVAMSLPTAPAGLLIYSGALICEPDWTSRASRLFATRIIQSHGRRDPILHLSQGQALRELLTSAGCTPKYLEFNGVHEIHPVAIMATADLLKELLP